jgi:hypothetical protein
MLLVGYVRLTRTSAHGLADVHAAGGFGTRKADQALALFGWKAAT